MNDQKKLTALDIIRGVEDSAMKYKLYVKLKKLKSQLAELEKAQEKRKLKLHHLYCDIARNNVNMFLEGDEISMLETDIFCVELDIESIQEKTNIHQRT